MSRFTANWMTIHSSFIDNNFSREFAIKAYTLDWGPNSSFDLDHLSPPLRICRMLIRLHSMWSAFEAPMNPCLGINWNEINTKFAIINDKIDVPKITCLVQPKGSCYVDWIGLDSYTYCKLTILCNFHWRRCIDSIYCQFEQQSDHRMDRIQL